MVYLGAHQIWFRLPPDGSYWPLGCAPGLSGVWWLLYAGAAPSLLVRYLPPVSTSGPSEALSYLSITERGGAHKGAIVATSLNVLVNGLIDFVVV